MPFTAARSDDRIEALLEQAEQALRADDHDRAHRLYRRVSRHRPEDGRWMNGMAFIREHAGDREAARALYARAADHGNATAHWNLGRLALADGDLSTARAELEQAVDRQVVHAGNLLGDLHLQTGDHAAAERAYVRAVELGDVDALNNLGLLCFETGEPERAVAPLSRALERGHVFAEHNLGSAHHRLGDLAAARTWYTRSYRHHGNLQSLENLGHVVADSGRTEAGSALVRASDKLHAGEHLTAEERAVMDAFTDGTGG